MASNLPRPGIIETERKQEGMRSAKRRERQRRLRITHSAWQYNHCLPQVFDRLEYLAQKLDYSIPDGTISQVIITADYYFSYTLNRYLFSGTRTAIFQTLESALSCLQESEISQLVVDMQGLFTSCFDTLACLRLLTKQRNNIQIFILLSRHDEDLSEFITMAGPFHVLTRRQRLPELRHALLSAELPPIHSGYISQADWEMVSLLLQGQSLKKVALIQAQPYHRVIYRLNQLITLLQLPNRQRFLHLIHRLNVTSPHLI